MAREKFYRRFIRINGELHTSPRFDKKRDADLWYDNMKRQKNFSKCGFKVTESNETTVLDYSRIWLTNRMKNYPKATWSMDEQRLRTYILPELADLPLAQVTPRLIREVLKGVTDKGLSVETRTRVKALASKLFSDAFNEELIPVNPVYGVRLDRRRQGAKKPEFLTTEEAVRFHEAAVEMGPQPEFIAMCGLFIGLRKSEIIGLKESDFDLQLKFVTVQRRLEQASLSMQRGTKAGEFETRRIPIPKQTVKRFAELIKQLKGGEHILGGKDRPFMSPRTFHTIVAAISKRAGMKTSSHKLRHTFGREFTRSGGNVKALQAILGHSSSKMTDRYSDLDERHIGGTTDIVSYGVKSKVES